MCVKLSDQFTLYTDYSPGDQGARRQAPGLRLGISQSSAAAQLLWSARAAITA